MKARILFSLGTTLVATILFTNCAWGQQEQAYSFNGTNGLLPEGGLVADAKGNLYGTTLMGGTGLCSTGFQNGCGVVYEMSPSSHGNWKETVLYNFAGGSDGANPNGSLILDQSGNLYGVTSSGGPSNQGTVFEVSPPSQPGGNWTEAVLYAFSGTPDGSTAQCTLLMDQLGNLYGTTTLGGSNDVGTVFELAPPAGQGESWTETVIHSLTGFIGDGSLPTGPLVFDAAGNLYGTAAVSGPNGGGTVFELSPPSQPGGAWTPTVLYAFAFNGVGGSTPYGGVVFGPKGALFGTTQSGGADGFGTIFRLRSQTGGSWSENVLHNFEGGQYGYTAINGVVFAGPTTLYGTVTSGGINSTGGVFELVNFDGVLSYQLYSFGFNGPHDAAVPEAGVIVHNGALYGTTANGGANDAGTVFRLY